MSISTEINRLNSAKASIKSAIEGQGVTVPSSTTLSGYGALIDSISTVRTVNNVQPDSLGNVAINKKGSISLTTNWTGSDPYTQAVTVSGATVTNNSKIDLQPTSEVLEQFMDDGVIGIYIVNDNGTLTCTVMGEHPTVAINNIQVLVTEVVL